MATDNKAKKEDKFSQYNLIDISKVQLFREGWKSEDYVNVKEMVMETVVYEDLFEPTISARMTISDPVNMIDSFPIVGGEHILMSFKTPSLEEEAEQEFVIYKVGNRSASAHNEKHQQYVFFLCTLDRYNDAHIDISKAFRGTYTEIMDKVLTSLNSTKSLQSDESSGIQKFVCPFWSPLKTCKWIAERSIGPKFEPFVFYEDLDGYRFKNMRSLLQAESKGRFFIQPKQTQEASNDPEQIFRTVTKYEWLECNDRLFQNSEGLFGSKVFQYNIYSKTLTLNTYDYEDMFGSPDAVMLEKYPIYNDVAKDSRNKSHLIMERKDGSHLGSYYKKMMFGMLATYGLRIVIPGDSRIRVGMVIEMGIPAHKTGVDEDEKIISGRWLITSLKHIIKKDQYELVLELAKDSTAVNVKALIQGE